MQWKEENKMRKITSLLVGAALMLVTGSAWAIPTTWTDTIDFNPDILIPPTYFYTHNISDEGFRSFFMGGNDTISSYILTISLYDDNKGSTYNFCSNTLRLGDGPEAARIMTTGGVYSYNFNLTSNSYTGNLLGRFDLWADGRLGVLVSSTLGDFYLASSTLTAYGDNGTAPVPEPGTMVLLGFGLLGIAIYGKRRMNKEV
jgi:PEP-CTERM motif